MRKSFVARSNARGTEHHDGIAHMGAAQPVDGVDVLGENAQRPRDFALHELRILVGKRRLRQMAPTLHFSPSRDANFDSSAMPR
jgi:hypothetical protein